MTNWTNEVEQMPELPARKDEGNKEIMTTRSFTSSNLKNDSDNTSRKSKFPIDDYLDPSIVSDLEERFPLPPLSPPPPSPNYEAVKNAENLLQAAQEYITNINMDLTTGSKILDKAAQSPGEGGFLSYALSGESNTLAVRKVVNTTLGSSRRETKNAYSPTSTNERHYSPKRKKSLSARVDEKTKVTDQICRSSSATVEAPLHLNLQGKTRAKELNTVRSCSTHSHIRSCATHNLAQAVNKESSTIVSPKLKITGSQRMTLSKSPSLMSPGTKRKSWHHEGAEISDELTADQCSPSSTISSRSKLNADGSGKKPPPNSPASSVQSLPRGRMRAYFRINKSKSSPCMVSKSLAEIYEYPERRDTKKSSVVKQTVDKGVGPDKINGAREKTSAVDAGVNTSNPLLKDAMTSYSREEIETLRSGKVVSKQTVRFSLGIDHSGSDELQENDEEACIPLISPVTHSYHNKARRKASTDDAGVNTRNPLSRDAMTNFSLEKIEDLKPKKVVSKQTVRFSFDKDHEIQDSAEEAHIPLISPITHFHHDGAKIADLTMEEEEADIQFSRSSNVDGEAGHQRVVSPYLEGASPRRCSPESTSRSMADLSRSTRASASEVERMASRAIRKTFGHQTSVYEKPDSASRFTSSNAGKLSTSKSGSDTMQERNARSEDKIFDQDLINDVARDISFDELVEDISTTRDILSPKEMDTNAYIDGNSLTAFIEDVLLGEFKRVVGEAPSPKSRISDLLDELKGNTAHYSNSDVENESKGDILESEMKRLFLEDHESVEEPLTAHLERVYTPQMSPSPAESCNEDKEQNDMIVSTPPLSPQIQCQRDSYQFEECAIVKVITPPTTPKKLEETISKLLNKGEDMKLAEKVPPTPRSLLSDENLDESSHDEVRFDSVSTPIFTPSVTKISSEQLLSPSNSFSSAEGKPETEGPLLSHLGRLNDTIFQPQEKIHSKLKETSKPSSPAMRKEDNKHPMGSAEHLISEIRTSFLGEAQPSSKLMINCETQTDADQSIYPSVGAIEEHVEIERLQDFDTTTSFSMDPEVEGSSITEIGCFSEGEVKFKSSHRLKVVNLDSISMGEIVSGKLAETGTNLQCFDSGALPSSAKPALGYGLAESWSEGEIRDKWTLIHSNPSSSIASDASKSFGEISEKALASISSEGELMLSDQEK